MKKTVLLSAALISLGTAPLLSGCLNSGNDAPQREELIVAESQRLNDWFAARYEEQLARSPMSRTFLGLADGLDKLDDVSQIAINEEMAISKSWLDEMRREFDICLLYTSPSPRD